MQIEPLSIPDVLLIHPQVHSDSRGHFYEMSHVKRYKDAGISTHWVQDNLSNTHKGIIRGMHFQWPKPQGKLISVVAGNIFDVAVDMRQGSPSYGNWVGTELNDVNCNQLWVPEGFAHGFQALSKIAVINYKCTTNYWSPEDEQVLRYNDPDINIKWPLPATHLHPRDENAPLLRELEPIPTFE